MFWNFKEIFIGLISAWTAESFYRSLAPTSKQYIKGV